MMRNAVKTMRSYLGFTRSGASVAGKQARIFLSSRETRQLLSGGFIAVITALILIRNLANMGGSLVLAFDATPQAVIDATTIHSVQVPVNYAYFVRGFAWYHPGIDLAAHLGLPVRPIMAGIVKETARTGFGLGKYVVITHEGSFESTYAHFSEITVQPGEKVGLDTVIGEIGSTGFSTGPHLHLEIRQNGSLVNPADIVPLP